MTNTQRDVIFISHATPEDNEFVRWLGSRLVGLGYNVWADVFELKGGSPFWRNIEEAIRQRALKVIYVASTASVDPARTGVRNELAAAAAMANTLGDSEYIIPVRLDKVDFGAFPIQVVQLNALDFSSGWGGMLPKLIETLEKSNVPVDPNKIDERMRFWKERTTRDAPTIEVGSELLLTNLLPVDALPRYINFYEFNGPNTEINAALEATGIPYFRFARLIVSFAATVELQAHLPPQFTLSLDKRIDIETFLKGPKGNETAPQWQEARRILSYLLRRHVEQFLVAKGLKAYETSSGNAFYFPTELIPGEKIHYATPDGKTTRKQITGRSERYKSYWHLSMLVNIDLGPPAFVRFKPYICFSEDGKEPYSEPKRISALRRRFCKNWWNKHWRQLQQAFIAFLSGGAQEIVIPFDGTEELKLKGNLLALEGVRRLAGDIEVADLPEDPEEPLDDDPDDLDLEQIDEGEEDAA